MYGGWWAKSATEGRESPGTNHHRHPLLVLLHLGETWRLFGVGNEHRAPAIGSSGETRGGNAGRQPAALAAKAVTGYLTLTRPIDTGNGLQRNPTHREGRSLPEDCRRRFAAPDAAAPAVPVVATTVVGLPASSLVDSVRRYPLLRRVSLSRPRCGVRSSSGVALEAVE